MYVMAIVAIMPSSKQFWKNAYNIMQNPSSEYLCMIDKYLKEKRDPNNLMLQEITKNQLTQLKANYSKVLSDSNGRFSFPDFLLKD